MDNVSTWLDEVLADDSIEREKGKILINTEKQKHNTALFLYRLAIWMGDSKS